MSRLNVDQFYGIELEEFPALIAETALWMTDHIANQVLAANKIDIGPRIPLTTAPAIRNADALEVDWADVLPPAECSYVLGNPPFVGAKYQSDLQRAQVRRIAGLKGSGGTLDYVAAWFLKAGAYLQGAARIGFVATNSVTQGEQVAQLWPLMFGRCGLEIAFAHRTFAWGSDARGKAHVHVVVLGLARRGHEPAEKRLFSYAKPDGEATETRHAALTAYLFDAGVAGRHRVVKEEARPINGAKRLKTGVQMIDDGIYVFDATEKAQFLEREPGATKWFREFIGGDEYINGFTRFILYLDSAAPDELRRLPSVSERD